MLRFIDNYKIRDHHGIPKPNPMDPSCHRGDYQGRPCSKVDDSDVCATDQLSHRGDEEIHAQREEQKCYRIEHRNPGVPSNVMNCGAKSGLLSSTGICYAYKKVSTIHSDMAYIWKSGDWKCNFIKIFACVV